MNSCNDLKAGTSGNERRLGVMAAMTTGSLQWLVGIEWLKNLNLILAILSASSQFASLCKPTGLVVNEVIPPGVLSTGYWQPGIIGYLLLWLLDSWPTCISYCIIDTSICISMYITFCACVCVAVSVSVVVLPCSRHSYYICCLAAVAAALSAGRNALFPYR